MKNLFNKTIWIGIVISFIFVFIIGFWVIYPHNPLVLENVTLDRTEVSRGEHILVSADYCKNTEKEADLFITFIDGIIYNTPPQVIDLKSGCHKTTISIYVPKALPTGEFMLKGVFRYKVNPIKTIEVNGLTNKFTIIK